MATSKIIKKPGPGDLKVERMRLIYTKAEQNIIKELTRKRSLELVDYSDLAALERVQKILRDMTDEAEEYIPMALKEKFYKADDLPSAPYGYYNAEALTGTQTAIVERLVDNLLADIDEAAAVAYKSAEEYLAVGRLEADALRNAALEMVTKLEAEGKGWNTIQNKMAAELNAKGITSFVDKAGRQWGLSSYCSMATRTTARQAEVAATLTSDDWDLWQIVKIGSTCPLCSVYEGRVYSKSGTNPDYPPLSTAFGKIDFDGSNDLANTYLNIHPNCLHSLIRYTTMGKTEEQIQRDKDFSSFQKRPANVDYRSKKQVQAYREKEQARAQYRNDVKQFKKYKAALGNDMPKTFETFEKHKKAGDEVYKGWEEKFQKLNKNAKTLEKSLESGIMESRVESGTNLTSAASKFPNKIVKAEVINEAINAKYPFYAEDLKQAYLQQGVKPKKDCYDVMLHGAPFYTTYEKLYKMDAETLSYIISGRRDWNGSDIRLISCSTGREDKFGNCFAKELAKRLKVNVYAPIDDVYIVNGKLLVGDDLIPESKGFRWFTP